MTKVTQTQAADQTVVDGQDRAVEPGLRLVEQEFSIDDVATQSYGSAEPDVDLDELRVNPEEFEGVTEKVPLTIRVRKPSKQEFIRVHPDKECRLSVEAIHLKDENEFYIVTGALRGLLADGGAAPYTLYSYITRAGTLSLWPIRETISGEKENEWYRSARKAAEIAKTSWVRVVANTSIGGYDLVRAVGSLSEPKWPDISMKEIIKVAFAEKGWIVRNRDHDLIKQLQGRL